MKFKIGQKVVVKKAFYSRNGYYHTGSLRQVPLGIGAVVDRIDYDDKIHLRFNNRKYGIDGGWYVHPDEIKSANGNGRDTEDGLSSRLKGVLTIGEPKEKPEEKLFRPKFNAKNEFPAWVRAQFPELEEYASNGGNYKALYKRKAEVTRAARKAWQGVTKHTHLGTKDKFGVHDRYCHRNFLRPIFNRFYAAAKQTDMKKYTYAVDTLVKALEVSGMKGFPYIDEAASVRRRGEQYG